MQSGTQYLKAEWLENMSFERVERYHRSGLIDDDEWLAYQVGWRISAARFSNVAIFAERSPLTSRQFDHLTRWGIAAIFDEDLGKWRLEKDDAE